MLKNNLKKIRMKEYMMNQKEFASLLDIPEKRYWTWESGKSQPSLEISLRIGEKLNKDIKEIWYLEK